jgi:hypothetical protein
MVIYKVKFEYDGIDASFLFSDLPSKENVLEAIHNRINGWYVDYGVYSAIKQGAEKYDWSTISSGKFGLIYLDDTQKSCVSIDISSLDVMEV